MSMSPSIDNEKLLYKLVIQFLIFCQGSHRLLEPHLAQIGKRLKTGATMNDLLPELHAISKTLLHISKQAKEDVAEHSEAGSSGQHQYIIQRLDELLAEIDVPQPFHQQKILLSQRVKGDLSDESYKGVIDSTITLLLNIRNYARSEQNGLETFLTDLSDKLGQIEQHTESLGESNRQLIDSHSDFSSALNQQLGNIKLTAQQAVELSSLKLLTEEHLDDLMTQLLEYMQQDDTRQRHAQDQLDLMSQKLQLLETETELLRTKLKIEHDRAMCDALTGLPNRMAYKERIEMEFNRWRRYKTPLTMTIWDVDFFKRINDEYGHKAGDKTLSLIGQLLTHNCRETDFVARYGGEEFVMLLPSTRESDALVLADKIREVIQQCSFNSNGEIIDLTISCGISEFSGDDHYEDVFVRADQALYQAKQAGRNSCKVFRGALPSS